MLHPCRYCTDGYRDLPFPFEDIGLGKEGEPASLDVEHEMSFEGLIGMLRSWSAVTTAKQQGVDLLGARVVKELEEGWGGVGRSWCGRSHTRPSSWQAPRGPWLMSNLPYLVWKL
jgi:hypothetical protein